MALLLSVVLLCTLLVPSGTAQAGLKPTVTKLSPSGGNPAGGTAVTITGTGFMSTGTTSVTFGGSAATSVTVVNSTTITAVSPAHATGSVDVQVTNPDTMPGTLALGYAYEPAPVVRATTPSTGSPVGGQQITIAGAGFLPGATVTFDGIPAQATVTNSTLITATSPAHGEGQAAIGVRNPDGQTATLAAAYAYRDGPAITRIFPAGGVPEGGSPVLVTGSGFLPQTAVLFDGEPAASISFQNDTALLAMTPAHTPGRVNVTVTNPDGQSTTRPAGFAYRPPPSLESVSPSGGGPNGGTLVTIKGTGFLPNALVLFGAIPAPAVAVASANLITAVAPAQDPGSVTITVRNPDTQVGALANAYTYRSAPTVQHAIPNAGSPRGATQVTIVGTGFQAGAIVDFDGVPATATVLSPNSILATTPPHGPGPVDVVVTNTDTQSGTLEGGFTFRGPPTIQAISPPVGPAMGGNTVEIDGAGFLPAANVTFGGIPAATVHVTSATTITAVVPAHAPATVDVDVRNPDAQIGGLRNAYTYRPRLSITNTYPFIVSPAGGVTTSIGGTGFQPGALVWFGGIPSPSVTVTGPSSLTAVTPAHPAGAVNVTVTNPSGESVTVPDAFNFGAVPTGEFSISPNATTTNGGASLILAGSHFGSGATVRIGDAAAPVASLNATRILATAPPHHAGAFDVIVALPDGSATRLAAAFTYTPAAPPRLSNVTPASGDIQGGTNLTLDGTGFVNGTTILVDGTPTAATPVDATRIAVIAPPHSAGPVDLEAINPDGQNSTLTAGFNYTGAAVDSASSQPDQSKENATLMGQHTAPAAAVPFLIVELGMAVVLRRRRSVMAKTRVA